MWSKILCQINQKILKASKNNHSSRKVFQLMCTYLARICCGPPPSCFIYSFTFQVISQAKLSCKDFTGSSRYFHIKTKIPTNLVTKIWLFCFCPFGKSKIKNQVLESWWSGNGNICFLSIASRTLLQRDANFNSLL